MVASTQWTLRSDFIPNLICLKVFIEGAVTALQKRQKKFAYLTLKVAGCPFQDTLFQTQIR